MKDVALVCLLLLAVGLLLLTLLYIRYRNSPAARWKARVRASIFEHQARLRHAQRELAAITQDAEDRVLRNDYLSRQLEGVAVEELARYPGIGPVTVSRLRDAGLATVAACFRARLSTIPGIGPVREADLKDALKQLRREADSRFDAGASAEAAAFKAEHRRRLADREQRRVAVDAVVRSAAAVLATLGDRVRIAQDITFIGHLTGRLPAGLTADVMNEPLVPPVPPAVVTNQHTGVHKEAARTVVYGRPPAPPAPKQPVEVEGPRPVAANPTPPIAVPRPVETTQVDRLRAVIGLGLAVARADGRIAAAERKQVRAFVERRYATGPELAGRLDTILNEVEGAVPNLGDALGQVKRTMPADAWAELYQFAVSVTDSAGERNTREIECLARVAEELGVAVKPPPPHVPAPVVASEPDAPLSEPDCRAALEIAPETPLAVELIRRQYRLLSDRFAPDKFATHGPEFVRMAAEKRDRAERAARHLLAGYNEPLEPATPAPPADLRHNPLLDELFGG